ncbi:MAG: glutamate synthase subunit alpha, partial [Hymenobacter sp.]
ELGFRTLNEMVGRSEFLKVNPEAGHWKAKLIDLDAVLHPAPNVSGGTLYNSESQDHGIAEVLDWQLLEHAQPALERQEAVAAEFDVKNTDRTIGTLLSNEIAKRYHAAGLPADTIRYKFTGSAGQSFGAFSASGLTFKLEGEANDYVGKGLSGARLAIFPPAASTFIPENNILIGNVALYGATSGELYVRGKAGERFAVRNSGATAVVEGVGDHGCEYMTGGRVLVLGGTGRNFAAGMSGGLAWVYDPAGQFPVNCNPDMVALEGLTETDETEIQALLQQHHELTGSHLANFLLGNWEEEAGRFVKVFPLEYKRVLEKAMKVG